MPVLEVAGTATIEGRIGSSRALGNGPSIGVTGSLTALYMDLRGGADVNVNGGVLHDTGSMVVNHDAGEYGSIISVSDGGTIDVGYDMLLGSGADLQLSAGGVVIVANKLDMQPGSQGQIASGTIEARTISLDRMSFLQAVSPKGEPGLNVVTGIGGAPVNFDNDGGTLDVSSALTVNGNLSGFGTTMVGDTHGSVGALTVNGFIAMQAIIFGEPGSTLFAEDIFRGNDVLHFVPGDTIATPGIQSIDYDAPSHVLTIDKADGQSGSLTMVGDFTGEQFTLSDNEFITLQPSAA